MNNPKLEPIIILPSGKGIIAFITDLEPLDEESSLISCAIKDFSSRINKPWACVPINKLPLPSSFIENIGTLSMVELAFSLVILSNKSAIVSV